MKTYNVIIGPLLSALFVYTADARIGNFGNNARVNVQNRSAPNPNRNNFQNRSTPNLNRDNVQNRSTANLNRNDIQNRSTPNLNRNANVNQNANVNRNVNVNQNVNVNSNVRGGYYGGAVVYNDNSWNWGSFAAGAATGVATTAAVAAATRPATTTLVAAPAVGTVVNVLPTGCGMVAGAGTTIYQCSNVYYRPYYQGSALVYQVVKYP